MDDRGTIAAMQAPHTRACVSESVGRQLLAFKRTRDEIVLRCVRENEKAWRWHELEDVLFEKEEIEPSKGFMMK